MNSEQSDVSLTQLCRSGRIYRILEEYLSACSKEGGFNEAEAVASSEANTRISKHKDKRGELKPLFPNLAGFCRYLKISIDDFEAICDEFPSEYGRILTTLEDEALNSELSSTLVSAYLKKRLKYDRNTFNSPSSQMEIKFEHDIWEDGE